MFPVFGPSSAEPAECVEVTVILSFYVISLRLTAGVSPVTISLDATYFHCMKLKLTESKKEPMTTESLLIAPERAIRVAPSVLVGIGAFAAVGIYVLVGSVELNLWTSLGPGPGLFPFAMGAVLVAMAVLWLVQELRRPSDTAEGVDRGLVIAVVLSLTILAALMDLLGFQLSMCLFLMYHLRLRGRRSWVSSLITALAGSVGAFYAFNYGLNVTLPVSAFPLLNTIGL